MERTMPAPMDVINRLTREKLGFWAALGAALAADLGSKSWATWSVQPTAGTAADITPIIEGVIALKWAQNTGAAFSMFDGQPVFLSTLAVVMLAFMAKMLYDSSRTAWTLHLGLGLVFAGAVGNLADRLRLGFVRDFLFFPFELPLNESVGVIPRYWPVFNVADMCIIAGAVLLILSGGPEAAAAETPEQDDAAANGEAASGRA